MTGPAGKPPGDTGARPAGRLNLLRARRLGIDTQQEMVVFMRADCPVCRAEGFAARSRVRLSHGPKAVIATLYQITNHMLEPGEAGLSDAAWTTLGLDPGEEILVSHPRPLESLGRVRAKVFGHRLDAAEFDAIIDDVSAGRYSEIHLASFITACSARPLDLGEMTALTRAMVEAGERIDWAGRPVMDKHCVGGLPGNRTTPIVVAIVTALGLIMPKTSSRAITSPAGTADMMETVAPVDLDIPAMRRVVEREGGCIVWGGAVRLSPADDILIRVERALDIDSEGQLVASVLSKKIAAGATQVVLDIPVGPTAKVRSPQAAASLTDALVRVARTFSVEARAIVTDGIQPVGRGIGPALEARDVLAVLQNHPNAPPDLRRRSIHLAAAALELGRVAAPGGGEALAERTLADGTAWKKFQRICAAQGGMREPPAARHRHTVRSGHVGRIGAVDNRRIAKLAKLSGAPDAKAAGLELHVRIGDPVWPEQPLFTLHADSPGELAYALEYAAANDDIVTVSET